MSIVRDDGDARLTGVDRMIEEFRTARSRRLAKAAAVQGGQATEAQRDARDHAAVAVSTTTPPPRSNG